MFEMIRVLLDTSKQLLIYERSIHATLNLILAYAPVFMQYIIMFYVPFHTRLGIINSPSLL